jgi:hypothetical protein
LEKENEEDELGGRVLLPPPLPAAEPSCCDPGLAEDPTEEDRGAGFCAWLGLRFPSCAARSLWRLKMSASLDEEEVLEELMIPPS